MNGFECYQTYLAIKLHFTSPKYNFFKFSGKITNASISSFDKRRDRFYFDRLARKYNKEEVTHFFLSNFVYNQHISWIGDFTEDVYKDWKRRKESLTYYTIQDVRFLSDYLEAHHLEFNDLFSYSSIEKSFPLIVKFTLQKEIGIETFIILDQLINFIPRFNRIFSSNIVWNNLYQLVSKYMDFIRVDLNSIRSKTLEVFHVTKRRIPVQAIGNKMQCCPC